MRRGTRRQLIDAGLDTLRHLDAVDNRPQPLDLFRKRFARGEIRTEQFEEAKRTLGV